VGVELWVGEELCVTGELCAGPEETDELATEELLTLLLDAGVVLVGVFFGLGFWGGACSAGTAPALVKGVMLACCPLVELD
jgi:hypothetical protein